MCYLSEKYLSSLSLLLLNLISHSACVINYIYNYNQFGSLFFQDVYLPGDPVEDDEELTFDKSAYLMYHAVGAYGGIFRTHSNVRGGAFFAQQLTAFSQ